MYRLLTYFSCCLLLVAGTKFLPSDNVEPTTSIPEEEEFPVVFDTWSDLGLPSPEEEAVMDEQKINWLPVWQEHDLREDHERKVRSAQVTEANQNVVSPSVAPAVIPVESSSTPSAGLAETTSTTTRVASSIVAEESISPVRDSTIGITESIASSLLTRDGNGQVCDSSSERGLTRLIRTARPLLPADNLRNILANAIQSDSQVKNLLQLLRSDVFREKVQSLRTTKQLKAVQDYVCQRLKLDYAFYLDYVKVFLNIYIEEAPTSVLPNRRPGIRGLLQDLRYALPRTQLRDLYTRLYTADRELSESVRLIRGREFRNMLRELRSTKEYIVIRDELRKADVPLQQLSSLVATALGWSNTDMGDEIIVAVI